MKPTTLTAFKMSLSAAIAFMLYQSFSWPYGYWSIITISAVTQAGLSNTFIKGVMRISGTILGALLGYGLGYYFGHNLLIILPAFFLLICFSSFFATQPTKFSYGGVVFGLTMAIVLFAKVAEQSLWGLAMDRTLEVLLGIVVLFVVNLGLSLILDNPNITRSNLVDSISSLVDEAKKFTINIKYFKVSIKVGLACLITSIIWIYFDIPEGYWSTITCLVIMEESVHATHQRSLLRFLAHVAAALFGVASAIIIGDQEWLRLIPLIIGFAICGYIIGYKKEYAYIGNNTGTALAIMLLINPNASFDTIAARFFNVVFGILVGILITRYLFPPKTRINYK